MGNGSGARVRRQQRDKLRAQYQRNPQAGAKRMRDYRMERKLIGLCVQCILPALEDSCYCELHRAQMRTHARNYQRKLRSGDQAVLDMAPKSGRLRKRRCLAKVPEPTYIPFEDELGTLRNRLLRGLRFRPWTLAGELFEALGIDDVLEMDSARWALLRSVRSGLVERRGVRNYYEHRLTVAGRSEVDRLRLPRELRRAA